MCQSRRRSPRRSCWRGCQGDRKKSSQQTKKASGSTIDAIREAKRKHRLAVKASGRRKADTGKSGADVPVEVFVPPGYSFDLGTSNDTTIYTDGSITRNISVQNISSEQADGHANVSATNSAVDESSRKFKIGETFSIGGNGNQASLQEAFQNRRNARRSKRQSRQIPDALDEFVGSAAGGAGKVDDENSTTVAHTSGKRNPFRRSATEGVDETVLYDRDGLIEAASNEVFQELDNGDQVSLVSTLTPRRMSHNRPPVPPSDTPSREAHEQPLPWEDGSTLMGDEEEDIEKYLGSPGSDNLLRAAAEEALEVDLANQLRCCAELSDLQNPSAFETAEDGGEDAEDTQELVPKPPSGVPPEGTLAARCVQLRRAAEARVGPELFKKCCGYLQAVLSGDDLEDLDLEDPENTDGFYAVVKSSGISEEASRDLRQETMLLIHLESVLTSANRPSK
eukprot:g3899.t1